METKLNDVYKKFTSQMEKTISSLKDNLNTVRTGRANPAIFKEVMVDYYGTPTPLAQCAAINVPEPRTLTVKPWDKSLLKAIEKGILESDLGVNPMNDGELLRINIPAPTEERRKELVKVVKKYIEDSKIALRNERRVANDDVKKLVKSENLSEDLEKKGEDYILDLIHKYEKKVDEIFSSKESEILKK